MTHRHGAAILTCLILSVTVWPAWSYPADDPPSVPPPHPKKTAAELLVGKWRIVKENDMVFPPERVTVTFEFTKIGKLTIRVVDRRNRPPRRGEYRLDGKSLHLSTEANAESEARNWTLLIESITEEKMVTTTDKKGEVGRSRGEFERVVEKRDNK